VSGARVALLLGLLLLAALPALAPAQAEPPLADPYGAALAAARGEAEAGRWAAAARRLESPAATWPQDFPLQLQRAFYLLRAGHFDEAAGAYRRALALSPDSAEAQRGLDDARSGRGTPDRLWLGLAAGWTSWSGSPGRSSVGSGALSLDAQLRDHWTLGGLYRGFAAPVTTPGGGPGGISDLAHEGQLSLGYAASDWSLTLQGVASSSASSTSVGVTKTYAYQGLGAGLAASYRLGLEWHASAALIGWEDQSSAQLEVGAALPLGQHLRLEAGWRGQRLDGTVSGAALAGIAWTGPWTLSLRGEYGWQRRPWDLGERTLYGLPETLRGALRLQGSVPFTPTVRGWLSADLERWQATTTGAATADSTATRLTGGLLFSF
jgi:tetratricopeptide (TPR) repeat protein